MRLSQAIWIFSFLICLSLSQASIRPPYGFCTGKANGNYWYAKCSGKFYSCLGEATKVVDCSAGMVYNNQRGSCTSVANVPECGVIKVPARQATQRPAGFCNGRSNGDYLYSKCSNKYYSCYAQVTRILICKYAELYDDQTRTCRPENNVAGCGRSQASTTKFPAEFCVGRSNGNYLYAKCSNKLYTCFNWKTHLVTCNTGDIYDDIEKHCKSPNRVAGCSGSSVSKRQAVSPSDDFSCLNRPEGFYRHRDCNKYYRCYSNKLQINKCPPSLYFNIDYELCDYPSNVPDCISGTVDPDNVPENLAPSPPPIGFCTGKANGNYLYSICSSTFYNCYGGYTNILECPTGFIFNQKEGRCTSADNIVECGVSEVTNPPPSTAGPIDGFSCLNRPEGFYRHPDCSKYYRCYSGKLQVNKCPPSLYFNPDMSYCDYPKNVPDCIGGIVNPDATPGPTTKPPIGFCTGKTNGNYLYSKCSSKFYSCHGEATQVLDCSADMVFNQIRGYCTSAANVPECGGTKDDVSKPPNPLEKFSCMNRADGIYRHSDCTKYYRCVAKRLFISPCSLNLYFNPNTLACDYPQNVPDCINGILDLDEYDNRPTPGNTIRPPVGFCTGNADGNYLYSKCSSKYYTCVGEATQILDCPVDMIFNQKQGYCTSAANVPECGETNIDVSTQPSPLDTFSCMNREDGFYRHSDCTKYYACVANKLFTRPCPPNLYFNPNSFACDYPKHVPDCINGILNIEEYNLRPKPTIHVINPGTPDFSCINHPDGYYQHPDCTKFFHCYSKKVQIKSCPKGLYYNPDFIYCDYPENVPECVGGTVVPDHSKHGPLPTTSIPQANSTICADKSNGVYVHSTDCSKFYSCYNGKATTVECSAGHVFNPRKKHCDLPQNVPECKGRMKRAVNEEFSCEHRDDGFYEHKDCSKFYYCLALTKITLNCSTGLVYNPVLRTCDWPRNVPRCKSGPKTVVKVNSLLPKCKNGEVHKHSDCSKYYICWNQTIYVRSCPWQLVFNSKKSACDWENNVPECSLTNSHSAIKKRYSHEKFSCRGQADKFYRNEDDCSSYFECVKNNLYILQCPKGLVFSEKKNYCDWPVNVPGCFKQVAIKTTKDPKVLSQEPCKGKSNGLYAYPADCTKFYRCTFELAYILPCPKGLVFNEKISSCDWSRNVPECKIAEKKSSIKVVREVGTAFSCKDKPDGFYKHTDCSKFYRCVSEEVLEQDCAVGLYFNQKTSSCDWPANIPECDNKSQSKEVTNPIRDSFCTGKGDGFYKHPNCTKFYQCLSEEPLVLECPVGLYFSDQTHNCDWPANVPECNPEESVKTTAGIVGFSCPNLKDGFYKHPNCRMFYQCINGIATEKPCPKGFYFNPQKNYCDWRANVPECNRLVV